MKVIRLKSDEGIAVSVTMSTISGHACSDVVRREDFASHVSEHAAAGGHALVVMTGGNGILLYPSKGKSIVAHWYFMWFSDFRILSLFYPIPSSNKHVEES